MKSITCSLALIALALVSAQTLEAGQRRFTFTYESTTSPKGEFDGQDHDVTLSAKVSIGNGRFIATSHFSIPYLKWGMKDPSSIILRVSKTVELELRVAGTIRQESW